MTTANVLARSPSAGDSLARDVFIRDDDVGALTPELEHFADVFARRRIPVSYQIIPEQLTEECAAFLLERRAAHPGLIDFGQHGLRHEMKLKGRTVYREFGPERAFEAQYADIRAGRELLAARMGEAAPSAVFTPPQHRYDANTLRALERCGFRVLSAAAYADPVRQAAYAAGRLFGLSAVGGRGIPNQGRMRAEGLFELSIAVAVDDFHAVSGTADQIMARLARARARMPVTGLMFHHAAYAASERRAFLVELADRLARLENIRFATIEALWRALAEAQSPAGC